MGGGETGREAERELTASNGSFTFFPRDYEGRTLRGKKEAGSRQTPTFQKRIIFSEWGGPLWGRDRKRQRTAGQDLDVQVDKYPRSQHLTSGTVETLLKRCQIFN